MPMMLISLWRNIIFDKILSGAAYGVAANIYRPSSIAEMELTTSQYLLLALLRSLVVGDVMSCVLLSEICQRVERLRSRHHKVWLLEEFVFSRTDMENGFALLVELVSNGILKLPSYVLAIMTPLAKKYKITRVELSTLSEKYSCNLPIQLENAVYDNNPSDIFDLVSEGANIRGVTQLGDSLLHLAARADSYASIAALAFLNIDLEVVNSSNVTPLEEAVRCNFASSVKALLTAGAKFDKRLFGGDTYLHIAAEGAHNEALQALLEVEKGVNKKNQFGETPLSKAVIASNDRGIELLLEKGADFNDLHHIRLNDGDSIIHSVARSGNYHILKFLKNRKIPANLKNQKGLTPLHVTSNPSVMTMLLGMGVGVDIQDKSGSTPLMIAARNSKAEIVNLLLVYRADFTKKDKKGRTALHYAAEGGCLGSVAALLDAGAKVGVQDNNGDTPAFLAAVNNSPEVWQMLIEKVDLTLRDHNGDGMIHRVARCGLVDVVRALLDISRVAVDMKGKNQWTALHYAADEGYITVVKTLLNAGAVVNKVCQLQRTALHYAADKGYIAVVKVLLDAGAVVNKKCQLQKTALHYAADKGHIAVVKVLLDAGAAVNKICLLQRTALHYAAEKGHIAVVKALLDDGVEINKTCQFQKTALHYAAENGHMEVVKVLTDAGAAFNKICELQKTALDCAAEKGHITTVKVLLDAGAAVNKKNQLQKTALHYAAEKGHIEVVNQLLDSGADPSAKSSEGYTPLMLSCIHNHKTVMESLVDRGANVNARDLEGQTALNLAFDYNRNAVASYLISKSGFM